MNLTVSRSSAATRILSSTLHAALLTGMVVVLNLVCFAQAENVPAQASQPAPEKPLTLDERAELLKLIRSLQERVERLGAAQGSPSSSSSDSAEMAVGTEVAATSTVVIRHTGRRSLNVRVGKELVSKSRRFLGRDSFE